MSSLASRIDSLSLETPPDLKAWARRLTPWGVTLLALVARTYGIEANGLQSDETYGLWMASRTIPDLLRTVVIEGHDSTPPTFNLLLHFVRVASQELWAFRLISVIAGVGVVWLTFQLARLVIDFKVAALSALLIAISPFSIQYAQVARAHALASFFAVGSIYMFARLLSGKAQRRDIWLYAISTIAAISTHYLAAYVVLFENLVIGILAVSRRLARHDLRRWFQLQLVMGLAVLPVIWLVARKIPMASSGLGQNWLPSPSLLGMVRTAILWGTGDPSIGPVRFTVARLISLLVILSILGLGMVAARRQWKGSWKDRRELLWAGFVGAAFMAPWLMALGTSLIRKVFSERYFLYLIPFLLILLAWSVLRIRPIALGRGLMIALLGQTVLSLAIYYSFPPGEQWREAISYVNQERHVSDYVAAVPGYYMRPVAYYLTGSLPPHDYRLLQAPIAIISPAGFIAAEPASEPSGLTQAEEAFELAEQVWLVTGYAEVDPGRLSWFRQNYIETDRVEFQGVRVVKGERN